MSLPTPDQLESALAAAGPAHHDYEVNFLGGQRDEQWAGFYAAYVLGRLDDFTQPTSLTKLLKDAPSSDDGSRSTAQHVLDALRDAS